MDEEGYLRTGDAVLFADASRPEAGIIFDGRLGENFKLASGTWVSTGMIRVRLVSALAPDVSDAVITGHDRAALGALLFVVPPVDAPAKQALFARIRQKLEAYVQAHPSSSERVGRVVLVYEPPSLDAGETTDKGYLNQRKVLERRARLVEALYADSPDGEVITV